MDFQELIDPISKKDFFRDIWSKKPLLIEGPENKFSGLPNIKDFPRYLSGEIDNNHWKNTNNLKANAVIRNSQGIPNEIHDVPFSMYPNFYNNGFSLCFSNLADSILVLNDLISDLNKQSQLWADLYVTGYLTPPNSNGIIHYDSQHVFFIQREGTKFWRVSEKHAIKNPINNYVYNNNDETFFDYHKKIGSEILPPVKTGFIDYELSQGSVLYIPPGFYHVQETKNEPSLHYTLSQEQTSFWRSMQSNLFEILMKNTDEFNSDLRYLEKDERVNLLNKQLQELKERVSALTIEDLEKHLMSSRESKD